MKSNRIASIIIESNREVSESFRAYISLSKLLCKSSTYPYTLWLLSTPSVVVVINNHLIGKVRLRNRAKIMPYCLLPRYY